MTKINSQNHDQFCSEMEIFNCCILLHVLKMMNTDHVCAQQIHLERQEPESQCGRSRVFPPSLSPARAWAHAGAVILRSANIERSNQCPVVCLGPGAWQQSRRGRALLMFSCCRSSSISGSCSRVRDEWSVRLTGGSVQRLQCCGLCADPSL